MDEILNNEQKEFIKDIKEKIRHFQHNAAKSVNVHLINLYWEIGKSISEKQKVSWENPLLKHYLMNYKMSFQELEDFQQVISTACFNFTMNIIFMKISRHCLEKLVGRNMLL